MKEVYGADLKFNIFLGDQLNDISNSPSFQTISKELFSSKNIAFERSNSLLENIQFLLDHVIYPRNEIKYKVSYIFRERSKRETFFYKSILEENFVSSLIYMNYDYIFENNFTSLIEKNTPFSLSENENGQIPFYKIFGDFQDKDKCILSTQDLKKVKLLEFYKSFWNKLKDELEKNPTVLLGIDFRDSTSVELLDFIFSKAKGKHKQIYAYINKTSNNYLEKSYVKELINDYSIKIITGENQEFLNNFKTMIFKEFNPNLENKEETKKIEEELKADEVISSDRLSEEIIKEEVIKVEDTETIQEIEEINESKKLPIFEEESKKIILKNYIASSKKEEAKKETKIINVRNKKENLLETATEIRFKSLFLDNFPVKYKNFSNNLTSISIRDLGLINIDFGFEKQNSMAVRIIDYKKFRLIEMKRRDFKISIGVDLNSAICLKTNGYYEYQIYKGSKNSKLVWIFNFMMNLFQGSTIKFYSNNFICDMKVENFLEYGKFKALNEVFNKYEFLKKTLKINKNKKFSNLDNSFYQIDLLANNLNINNFDSWINAKIKLSEETPIVVGDKLILKRQHTYYFKELSYNLVEAITLTEDISKNEIKEDFLILKRKPVKIILERVKK